MHLVAGHTLPWPVDRLVHSFGFLHVVLGASAWLTLEQGRENTYRMRGKARSQVTRLVNKMNTP